MHETPQTDSTLPLEGPAVAPCSPVPGKKPCGKPGRKTKSADELEKRIEATAKLLGRGISKGNIKSYLQEKYSIGSSMAEKYIAKARDLISWLAGRDHKDLFEESIGFWFAIIQDPGADLRDKMRARERLDYLLRLEPPKEHHIAGRNGGPIETSTVGRVVFFIPENGRNGAATKPQEEEPPQDEAGQLSPGTDEAEPAADKLLCTRESLSSREEA